jgi:hypothetical protein
MFPCIPRKLKKKSPVIHAKDLDTPEVMSRTKRAKQRVLVTPPALNIKQRIHVLSGRHYEDVTNLFKLSQRNTLGARLGLPLETLKAVL